VIQSDTDPRWVAHALAHMDQVLVDHAHCERKAAATAMALVTAYPNRDALVRRLSTLAIEELRHFRSVHRLLRERGVELLPDRGDPYARQLMQLLRSSGGDRLTDRLLIAALIEARSQQRLALLGEALGGLELGAFYSQLAVAEARHAELFVELADEYQDPRSVRSRLDELARSEAQIVAELPIEARIH
jgi:tRNA-(ms[2]io[6]A)-hydroxylase